MNALSRARIRNIPNYGTDLQTYLNEDSYRCAMSLRSELSVSRNIVKGEQEKFVSEAENLR
jgi:hypothetical protein